MYGPRSVRVGFAAVWDHPAEPTWSYIPWHLRNALTTADPGTEVADVGLDLAPWQERALKLAHVRRLRGPQKSLWRYSPTLFRLASRTFEHRARRAACDAVLQTTPTATVSGLPYFVYHDAGLDALHDHRDPSTGEYPYLPGVPDRTTSRLRRHQREVFCGAAGVFAFSEWLAESLVRRTGVDPARVHVVPPGRNAGSEAGPAGPHPRAEPGAPRRRLLFVGKAFQAKGGDLAMAALERIRARHDAGVTLTIAGPAAPPGDRLPDGVEFLGRVPVHEVEALYHLHDLFVMPSRIEPFGIVFVEALAHGLPCVGRNAFAMPSMIRPGDNGALVDDDDPDRLADTIAGLLADDGVFERVEQQRAGVAAYYSWDRAAREMLEVITR